MSELTTVACRACGRMMTEQETVPHPDGDKGPTIVMFGCKCSLLAAVIFQPEGGPTPEQASWVEREVARRGAFFPQDYVGRGRFGR